MRHTHLRILSGIVAAAMFLAGCGSAGVGAGTPADESVTAQKTENAGTQADGAAPEAEAAMTGETDTLQEEAAEWESLPLKIIDDNYRTYYEVFVYSFCDSDGDGVGDLQGLISKLDYINDGDDATDTDLGCNGIWLMPVNPSPTYHKYDVADYYAIDEEYGTLEDFRALMEACDGRGIRVIMDLVLNHSSSENPWFQEACAYLRKLGDGEPSAEDCPYFAYYHFSKEQGAATMRWKERTGIMRRSSGQRCLI